MNILVLAIVFDSWKIEVDDVHDITNIETSSGNTSRNEDRTFAATESSPVGYISIDQSQTRRSLHGILTLSLSTIGVDGS